jgi:serine/threonine protein kinase
LDKRKGGVARTGRDYIGSYRLLKLIRAGHTCQVWEAMRDVDNQRCVLKALREAFRTDREAIGYLKHEFEVVKDLEHPNLIQIFEFDIVRGVPFLALELFNAQNLKQRMRAEWPDRKEQLPDVVRRAGSSIGYLHQHGWIHCDLKPDNLLIDPSGNVKLIDFAIAQRIPRGWTRWLVRRSKIQGTRSYMSPEQIRREAIDARSDIYSFGCLLFELFGERLPYTGGSADELLQRHLTAPVPSLVSANSKVSPELSELVFRAMAKDRDQRPDSMEVFLAEFNRIRNYWKN